MENKVQTIQRTVLGITEICLQCLYPVLEVCVMRVLPHIKNLYCNGHYVFLKLSYSVLSSKNMKGKGYLFEDIVVMLWKDCRKPQKP